ncbi:MAG TPA: S8 family serine peptidase [Gemmatimonadaceae bacterium]|nr:S8 family serine peptidase [Gemmatimonadaceae bacterium]
MLLTCLAVGLISCKDTIDPRETRHPSQVQQQEASGPVTVLRLTCTFSFPNGGQGEVRCGEPGSGMKRVSKSVILPASSEYAAWLPYYLVKDTVTETWSFLSVVQNLLGQPIGTLDGTTAVGTKVAVTYGPVASAGTGTVSIINADGTGTFTAPNQQYFNYPGTVAPRAYSTYRTWNVHVPNTVTEVTMGVAISTDFPAEQNVPVLPPDSTPAWVSHDTSWVNHGDAPAGFLKSTIAVLFQDTASASDKRLAIALVNGVVIGGAPFLSGDGYYLVRIEDDGTGTQLRAAIEKLEALPQVYGAALVPRVRPSYLRPRDGTGWTTWSLNPDVLSSSGNTWAFEAINAPMAWGCSVGSASTKIGVVDIYFDSTDVAPNVISGRGLWGADPDSARHGGPVSAILAARGNDSTGITGVMWHAALMLDEPGNNEGVVLPMRVMQAVERLANGGASAINLSWERSYTGFLAPTANDSASSDEHYRFYIRPTLRRLQAAGKLPLLVVSAGNSNTDAYLNPFAHIRDDYPSSTIVVGGSTRSRERYHILPGMPAEADRRGSNYGPLLDIYAPGKDVPTEAVVSDSIAWITITGTSFSAPFITGIAGLLKSFDPSLTSTQLHDMILDGASRGGRAVADPQTSNTVYLANAYESLKLAAERPGAPLCGNRVWSDSGAIFAERGSGSKERLFTVGEPAGYVNVLHGGRRIQFVGTDSWDDFEYDYSNGQWAYAGDPYGLPPGVTGGTWNSEEQYNHDGDSVVYIQQSGGVDYTQFTVLLRGTSGTSQPRTLTSWSVPISVPGGDECVYKVAQMDYSDSIPRFIQYNCQLTVPQGVSTQASANPAYSPLGDRVIVTVNWTTSSTTGLSAWSPCPWSSVIHDTNVQSSMCRSSTSEAAGSDAKVYSIRTSDGNRTELPSIPTSSIYWRGVSETGKELVIGAGHGHTIARYEPSPDGAAVFRTVEILDELTNCRIEYRDLASGAVLRSIPTNDPCTSGWPANGTISPLRVARAQAPVFSTKN